MPDGDGLWLPASVLLSMNDKDLHFASTAMDCYIFYFVSGVDFAYEKIHSKMNEWNKFIDFFLNDFFQLIFFFANILFHEKVSLKKIKILNIY